MDFNQRATAFSALGEWLLSPEGQQTTEQWAFSARNENAWFTPSSVQLALDGIAHQYLSSEALEKWANQYPVGAFEPLSPRRIGVIMAGNIPAVGFHDALCVLISGHRLLAKLSSQDSVLMRALLKKLLEIEPGFTDFVILADRLNDAEAFIATGSDNSARYFEYYFGHKPHLIRKNRTSVGILRSEEEVNELARLGTDVVTYFGLGCRNVSKLYVPEAYNFSPLYEAIEDQHDIIHHHKYNNNYDYNKSVLLVNQTPFLDNNFLLITENKATVSPISVLHFQYYTSEADLKASLELEKEKIQCLVSASGWWPGSLPFGTAQYPSLTDYADGVDTMAFLSEISLEGVKV